MSARRSIRYRTRTDGRLPAACKTVVLFAVADPQDSQGPAETVKQDFLAASVLALQLAGDLSVSGAGLLVRGSEGSWAFLLLGD
jgi:hypothetical protein